MFSKVTLVTMIAPSPDWFVGVDALELRPGGQWVNELTVSLLAWDAGTDDGTAFTSPNKNSNPKQPIALITGGPFFGNDPLGTFTFTRQLAGPSIYCTAKVNSQGCTPQIAFQGSFSLSAFQPPQGFVFLCMQLVSLYLRQAHGIDERIAGDI